MIQIESGLYVVIEQLEQALAPQPKPLNHGFSRDTAYRVLGAFSLSESGDAFFVLPNDEDQIWFISNRHLRTWQLLPGSTAFRLPVSRSQNGAHTSGRNGAARKTSGARGRPR